ncbi:MAG: bifunctional hydroxymethylpyrimidine kinase/phosphomethylpyrimidine kinase [Proteobacteria bacterium]|nr:bifunctional hydroxymethylpyrimidine kinase/phosphomethylpyrimidine kinase [Pseudomonadota bacterium]MBU1641049.1 bifunctional hydroxymethylpyrimidine kinase/phosphomethylpyrimidine kinase [Pseudomonadota bacterium]
MKIILTIAGSDPSGGAGIQADLKTITTLGCYGAAAITAITCQNTLGVSHCHPLPPQLVADQVAAVLSDMPPSHIKIGMTATAEIITTLAEILKDFAGEIIFDPVLKSSTGQPLLDADAAAVLAPLLARVSVLTPNISELASLSQLSVTSETQAEQAGRVLMKRYANIRALCIKGGHLNEKGQEVVDILLEKSGSGQTVHSSMTRHPRRQTTNTHGTGCTFASAFAAYHSRTASYQQAFEAAVSYVDTLLARSQKEKIGQGQGPLLHYKWLDSPK